MTNAPASSVEYRLVRRTASSMATSGGVTPDWISHTASRRMLRSSGAMRSSGQSLAWAPSSASTSSLVLSTPATALMVNSSGAYPSRSRWPSTSSAMERSVTSV